MLCRPLMRAGLLALLFCALFLAACASAFAPPTEIGSHDSPGVARDFVVRGGLAYLAYLADGNEGLRILDVVDPTAPGLVAVFDTPDFASGLVVRSGHAYLADGFSGLQIVDVSTPSAPTFVAALDTPGDAREAVIDAGLAYVADGLPGVPIVDAFTPSSPSLVAGCHSPDFAFGVALAGGLVSVADGDAGLRIFDSAVRCSLRRWRVDEPAGAAPNGTAALESVCGDDGLVADAGAFLTGSGLVLPGGVSGSSAAWVDLPNGLVSRLEALTVEAWFSLDGVQLDARLFDFGASGGQEVPPGVGGSASDHLAYAAVLGSDPDAQRTEMATSGSGTATADTALATTLGALHHVALTFEPDAAGPGVARLTTYRDGVEVAQLTTTVALADLDDVNVWLGRSNDVGDARLQGTLAEFRLHEQALTPLQVTNSFYEGPDVAEVVVPEPGLHAGLGVGATVLALVVLRQKMRAKRANRSAARALRYSRPGTPSMKNSR